MKRLFSMVLAGAAILMGTAIAAAADQAIPGSYVTETSVWWSGDLQDGTVVPATAPQQITATGHPYYGGMGKAFVQALPGDNLNRNCNAMVRPYDFTVRASVAQWLHVNMNGNALYWLIKKPGVYYADGLSIQARSNNQVTMAFTGFTDNNLKADSDAATIDDGDTDANESAGSLPGIQFALVDSATTVTNPATLAFDSWTNLGSLIDDTNVPSAATPELLNVNKRLWNRLTVSDGVAYGNYKNAGKITFTLCEMKNWLNSGDGSFKNIVK